MPQRKSLADIACVIRTGEQVMETALHQAIKLAAAHGAHLTVKIAAQQLATPYTPMWMSLPQALVADLNATTREKAEKVAEMARSAARIGGINADIELVLDKAGDAAERAIYQARACDLIVVDQPDALMDSKATVFEEALFRSGRPVLVATPKRPPFAEARKAAVAWDGSAHVARAMAEMLALFPTVDTVELIAIQGEKDLSRFLPGADAARHLSRKGVECSLVEFGRLRRTGVETAG